ncbi:BTAD domain-containing putative transcriptional regulator [Actinomadura rubrisoli]|uniref:BTAD domain-containing putative transcriptional regulator n=1 Tax=Actinomadura rubrisoli TaxID=2530368 RepID=UPI0014044A33|nr:BTAD domain-containing putative transcriptional regulator [Actinomadura rubrisoli]
MRIGILGPLEVRDEAARPVEVSGPRLRALLIRLAAEAGRPVSAERLLDDLWDGDPPGGGGNALQALVSRLRGVAGRDLVEHGPGGYRLGIDPTEVDAVAFERGVAAARGEADPARRADGLRRALELWRGPALTDVEGAGFAAGTITRLGELRLAAVEDRVDAELAAGLRVPQVAELESLAAAHPLRERLRGQLMRALYAAGRQADALDVYEETRRALADRLGVDPSPELAAVHMAILRGDAALGGRAPAREPDPESRPDLAAPPAARLAPTNLPAQLTSFVGREEESRRVGKLLRETRLVTLTGPGGAGKTRLARESAAPLVDEMPDGVWFVPLAPVSDPGDIVPAVLTALGVPETVRPAETRTAARSLDRLIDFLAAKRMIIVLDNCEHLVDAAARLVDEMLGQAPGVRVLATSREPLGITGESLCPVPSLPLPPPDGEDIGPDEALRYAAVRLFADRGAAVRPGFEVDAENASDVIAICRALDGIPLAIELAAARLRSLTSGQIAARLGDRFRLLTGGSRAALPRHRTLRAVVDWSWELLDDVERTVLRRLSVFAGGATPESAVRVCGLDAPDAPDPHDVIDVIAALIDKSLVLADGDAEVRYRLLETVRVYAGERLEEAGETLRVRSEHAAYCIGFAERAEPELRGRDQMLWADRLGTERDNFAAAFRHAGDIGDVEAGLRLVGGLMWFWFMSDMEIEAGGWAQGVRRMTGDTPPPGLEEQYVMCVISADVVAEMAGSSGPTTDSLQAIFDRVSAIVPEPPRHPALLLVRPAVHLFTGDMDGTRRELLRVMDHPDPWVRALTRVILGYVAMHTGQVEEAAVQTAAAHALFQELSDRFGLILSLGGLAQVALARGDLAEAVRLGEEAYGYAVQGVSPEQGAVMLTHLARARAQMGDVERAREELHRAMGDAERIGELADAAGASLLLSEIAMAEGDLAAARPHAERAYEWVAPRAHRPDFNQVARRTYSRLGCLVAEEGDLEAAARWHSRALDRIADDALCGNPTIAALMEGLAALYSAHGDHTRAAELLGTAHTLHGFRDDSCYEVRRITAVTEDALGEQAFTAAYTRGRETTREEVLTQASGLVP